MIIKNKVAWLNKFVLICSLVIPSIGLTQNATLMSFEIKDQFKREYNAEAWQDSILIIFGSDSEGSKYSSIWSKAINDSLNSLPPTIRVKRIGLADLRGVPFFLKNFIRGQFKDNAKKIILMDWAGVFSQTYGFEKDKSNILIFDINRQLVYQTSVMGMDKVRLNEMLLIIEKVHSSNLN